MSDKMERIAHANDVLLSVSKYGRRFFYSRDHDRVARFMLDGNGRLRLIDEQSGRSVMMVTDGRWRGFGNGGTLRRLVEDLAHYIRSGEKIRNHFGPWPEWICDGDLWGYGDAIEHVRAEVRANPAYK